VVHFAPDLLAVKVPGEFIVHGEQLLQVLFHVLVVALQLVSVLGRGWGGRAQRRAGPLPGQVCVEGLA
jgi:hypothetical protein